jgi:hypothetical protein
MAKKPSCDLPVMKSHCKTCPFKPDEKGRWQNARLANQVISRTLFNSQQICHGTEGDKREAKNRCKGAFDHNFEIYKRMGLDHLIK